MCFKSIATGNSSLLFGVFSRQVRGLGRECCLDEEATDAEEEWGRK